MFAHIFLAAAFQTAVPTATPPPLKTIATVHAHGHCAEIVNDANTAIDDAVDDNQVIAQTILHLRGANLDDGNLLHHNAAMDDLRGLASTLHEESGSGDAVIRQLRKLAAESPDPQQKKQLKSFVDALGGAIGRQLKMARDLDGFLAYVDTTDMERRSAMDDNTFEDDPFAPAAVRSKRSDTAYAQKAADDLQSRLVPMLDDEANAAQDSDGAFNGC